MSQPFGSGATPRHNVFISYHHANDQAYRDRFEHLFDRVHDVIVSWAVQIGEIPQGLTTETGFAS